MIWGPRPRPISTATVLSWSRRNGRTAGHFEGVLAGPKTPVWSCSCGLDGNWASRIKCRGCGGAAPRSITDKAYAAANSQPSWKAPKPAWGAWAKGSPTVSASARIKQLEDELCKLRGSEESTCRDVMPDSDAEMDKLRAEIRRLEGISGAEELLQQKRDKVRVLQEDRQSAQPLHKQLREIQNKLDRKERALRRREESELPNLRKLLEEAQSNLAKAEIEANDLQKEVAELKAKKERAVASQASDGHNVSDSKDAAWTRTEELLQGFWAVCADGAFQEQLQKLQDELQQLKPSPEVAATPARLPVEVAAAELDFDMEDDTALDGMLATLMETKSGEYPGASGPGSERVFDAKLRFKQQFKEHAAGLVRKRAKGGR